MEESGGPLSQMSEAVNNIDRPKTSSDDMHAGGGHMNLKVRDCASSECDANYTQYVFYKWDTLILSFFTHRQNKTIH